MKKRVCHDPPSSSSPSTSAPAEPSLDIAIQAESEIHQYLLDLPPAYKLDVDADPSDPMYTSASSALPSPASGIPPPYLIIQRCELVSTAQQLVLKLFHPFLRRSNVRPPDNAMTASINASHAIIHASRVARAVWQRHAGGPGGYLSNGANNIPSSHGVFYPFARQLFDATVVAAHIIIQAPQSVVAKVALDDVRIALDVLRDPTIATGRGRAPSRGGVEGCPSEAVTIVEMMLKKAEMAKRNYVPVTVGSKRRHDELDDNISKGFWLPYVGTGVATESPSSGCSGSSAAAVTPVNGHVHGSPRAKLADKSSAPESQSHHPTLQHRSSGASISTRERDKERKYPSIGIRTRTNTGSMPDLKSPGGSSRRRESTVSMPQPQQSSDPNNYGRSTSTAGPTPTVVPEAVPSSTGEFSLSAPYGMEDRRMVDMTVSPTTSRFSSQPQPQSQPAQPQSFAPHSFPSPNTSGPQHQHMYDSGSYVSEPGRQAPPTSYYVPYQPPPVPPPQSAFRPISGHGQPQSHPPAPQQPQHLDMMSLLPNQNVMDTDIPRVTKQEEGTDRHDTQPHPTGTSFTSPEGWSNSAVPRFAGQTPWDPGYNY